MKKTAKNAINVNANTDVTQIKSTSEFIIKAKNLNDNQYNYGKISNKNKK